jgi:hypothetical protein
MSRWRELLEQVADTYPHDVGWCDEAMAVLQVYVHPLKAGADAAGYRPGPTSRFPAADAAAPRLRRLLRSTL